MASYKDKVINSYKNDIHPHVKRATKFIIACIIVCFISTLSCDYFRYNCQGIYGWRMLIRTLDCQVSFGIMRHMLNWSQPYTLATVGFSIASITWILGLIGH
jgi:hypothetical protein